MKRLFAILVVFPLVLWGCAKNDDSLTEQNKKIVSYLTGTHTPRLVAEADQDPGAQLPFYTVSADKVYRYIQNYYDPERPTRPEVAASSRVTITFRAYVFAFANIADNTLPYFSNDPIIEQMLVVSGLPPVDWPFVPLTVDMNDPGIINGLADALLGCRQGDVVEAYMTYNMAYGDHNFNVVPRQSPIAYFFTVNSVN